MPGASMGIGRLNIPAVFIYSSAVLHNATAVGLSTSFPIFEAVSRRGKIDKEQLKAVECNACPTAGSCGGMYTANTMACAIEAMGMALPHDSCQPAVGEPKRLLCRPGQRRSGGNDQKRDTAQGHHDQKGL